MTTTDLHRAAEAVRQAVADLAEAIDAAEHAASEVIGYGPDSSALVDALHDLVPPSSRVADVTRALEDADVLGVIR